MNSTRSQESLQTCKVAESSNRQDGDDDSMDRDNRKVGSDNDMELQIWTGGVKAGEPIRKMLAEIFAAESVGEGFCCQAVQTVETLLPAESVIACGSV